MGHAKAEMMDAEDRGWHEPDGHVCADCVKDEFLKGLICKHADYHECDYCGQKTDSFSAAPVAVLMEPIAHAVFYYFNDPTQAGVTYDRGWSAPLLDTEDVLMTIGLECNDQLFEDISNAFVYADWVRAANGHWSSAHQNEELSAMWGDFVNIIKYEFRFFFQHPQASKPVDAWANSWNGDPQSILDTIGHLVAELDLLGRLPIETSLFRVRARNEGDDWPLNAEQMGAPPSELTRAGRMNPAGISYLYLAFEPETAFAEVLSGPPCKVAVARFETICELNILDLTKLPDNPSIFDAARSDEREAILFLYHFIGEISQPVRKNGGEHISYVPSQVVCEYFALVFAVCNEQCLDGIIYPSAVRPGGKNLVVFPAQRGYRRSFDLVEFKNAWEQSFTDWADISAALNMKII